MGTSRTLAIIFVYRAVMAAQLVTSRLPTARVVTPPDQLPTTLTLIAELDAPTI